MDCPACGGPVDAYVLGGREAAACTRCGWVGIEADHRGTGEDGESWDDALDRFYDRQVETTRRRADLPPVAASVDAAADGDGDVSAEGGDAPVADDEAAATADGDGDTSTDEAASTVDSDGEVGSTSDGEASADSAGQTADAAGDDESSDESDGDATEGDRDSTEGDDDSTEGDGDEE
jgi:hypothetical protein